MNQKIFVTSTEIRSGKSIVTLGLIHALQGILPRVGYMKPIGQRYQERAIIDEDALLIKTTYGIIDDPLDINPISIDDARADKEGAFEKIFASYNKISQNKDIVVFEGTDFTSTLAALEFDINAELAKDLNAPILLVANGSGKIIDEIVKDITECIESFKEMGCTFLGVVINRFDGVDFKTQTIKIKKILSERDIHLFGTVPNDPRLSGPRLREVAEHLNAMILYSGDDLSKVVADVKILAMNPEHALDYIKDKDGYLLITPGDRVDLIFTALIAQKSHQYPHYAGIILTGGLVPGENVTKLISGISDTGLSVLSVKEDTYTTALKVNSISAELTADDPERIRLAIKNIQRNVDFSRVHALLGSVTTNITTPRMFQYRILEMAKADKRHIVLPEGVEKRIIMAADEILQRGICDITLLGNRETIVDITHDIDADVSKAQIIDSTNVEKKLFDDYSETLYQLRKHKGVTRDMARELMLDPVHFATMMVYKDNADGLVSGSTHSTADTLRPVLQIIRAKKDTSIASSIFFMCMPDKVLIYGDCALVENPDAGQLADIAITSAETAKSFGIEPYVAMLSYSTGQSGKGKDVEKIREATKIAQQKRPDLLIEGPLQYDAATSEEVAKVKYKDSKVAGKATVYIFPDLDAGNTAYKAVQRSAKVPAIGPMIQGLNKPANDLSRGAEVIDIVYTIAITAIQAQQIKK